MADMQKKMAAALAAVNAYMQDEETQVAAQVTESNRPQYQQNLWGQSGRQEMMNMRKLMQMRAFGRCL